MNIDKLKGHIPESVLNEIPSVIEKFEINTPLRLAHFLGQCSHESGGFKKTVENLNYSAEGLMKVFPKYFKESPTAAQAVARKPEMIANTVYANQMGNGAYVTGDGWRFRGRGYPMLTGRTNYTAFDKFVPEDIVINPDLVASKYPLLSAGWFWSVNKLNQIADKGETNDVVKRVTKLVNGGEIGLTDRLKEFNKFYTILK